MSTVLWTNLLVNGEVATDENDKYALYEHGDKLDAISRKLGLTPFLDLCDTTDARFNMDDDFELPEGVESTNEIMAKEGMWVDAAQGVSLLEGLIAHLKANKVRFGLLSNDYDQVMEELAEALAYAKTAPAGAKFNFCVVM